MNVSKAAAIVEAERLRKIALIVSRYGKGDSFASIARDLGISRQRVRQIWFRAMAEGRK